LEAFIDNKSIGTIPIVRSRVQSQAEPIFVIVWLFINQIINNIINVHQYSYVIKYATHRTPMRVLLGKLLTVLGSVADIFDRIV
jgi:hypothetical protein